MTVLYITMSNNLKNIEISLRKKFNNFLSTARQPIFIEKPSNKFYFVEGSRILLLRHDRIGDIMVSIPFIKKFRSLFPGVQIDILLSKRNIDAKSAVLPYVNNIYVLEKGLFKYMRILRKLNSNKYDMVIDLFDNPSTTSSIIIKLANPLYALGLNKANSSSYTHVVPLLNKNKHHIVERIAQLLLPFGVVPLSRDLHISYPISKERSAKAVQLLSINNNRVLLGINLAGSDRSKYWGTDNYIELIKTLNIKYPDFDIIIFHTHDYANEFNELSKHTICRAAPLTNDFDDYVAMLSLTKIIISPDTAAVHIAAAFKIPCIGLFLWTGSKDTGLPWYSFNSPYRCLKTSSGNLVNITVDELIEAVDEIVTENKLYSGEKR